MPADEFKAPDDDTPDDTPDSPEDEGVEGDDDGDDDEDDEDDDAYGVTDSIGTGDVDGEEKPAVFVTTREPIALAVSRLDDPRAPESSALAAYIDGRMVARSAMPPEAIERLVDLKLFEEPVALGLFAFEDAPGYEAMRDADDDMDDDMDDDEDDDDESPYETILLGHIVRFAKDRKYPDNLAEEAVDILTRIIHGAEPLEDADRKAIDDLLGSL